SMALDDPEAWDVYRKIHALSLDDADLHVFTNLTGVSNVEVNAFQRLANVVIQKSLREGFGLVVAEALWKGTPVVAGRAGGIPLQMADDTGGILVDGVDDCARAILALLRDPGRARAPGTSGRERVRGHFLRPRRPPSTPARPDPSRVVRQVALDDHPHLREAGIVPAAGADDGHDEETGPPHGGHCPRSAGAFRGRRSQRVPGAAPTCSSAKP